MCVYVCVCVCACVCACVRAYAVLLFLSIHVVADQLSLYIISQTNKNRLYYEYKSRGCQNLTVNIITAPIAVCVCDHCSKSLC